MNSTGAADLARFVSDDEMRGFCARSNWRAAWVSAFNFALVAAALALPALWLNPLSLLAALLLLGGRQLGLAVLHHDCAHSVFFRSRQLNEHLGEWLFGGLINASLPRYRAYHLKHHRHAGTREDPDLGMANAYPAARASLRRKLWRDLSGRTGLKFLRGQAKQFGLRRNAPFLVSHAVLLAGVSLAGVAWTYLLWWAAWIFFYPLVTRIRFMSEHGVAHDRLSADPRENTATTLVRWWERLLIGPNFVNYHLEHHLAPGVPCYRLRALHQLLRRRGFYGDSRAQEKSLSQGYLAVLRKAVA